MLPARTLRSVTAVTTPKTILLVEDDPDLRLLVREVLELEGYRVVAAANGREALEALRADVLPDLILLDLMMPEMDGYQFRLEQGSRWPWKSVPVVVMTADASAIRRLEQTGSRAHLQKPIDVDQLLGVVARCTSAGWATPSPG